VVLWFSILVACGHHFILQAAALRKNHQPPVTPITSSVALGLPCVMYPINHTQGPEKDLPRKPDICIKFSGEPVLVGGGMCSESPPPPSIQAANKRTFPRPRNLLH
jgi:hypothetical protein